MSPCKKCDAKCCRYFAIQIDAPRSKHDIENIRWFLAHKGVTVFIDRRRWHLDIASRCRYLTKDHRCRVYDKRPLICREHETDSCEGTAKKLAHSAVFRNMKEFDGYMAERRQGRRKNAKNRGHK